MTKDDKARIAKAYEDYASAATQCSNVLYNLAQNSDDQFVKDAYGELVRNHDAARAVLRHQLQLHILVPTR